MRPLLAAAAADEAVGESSATPRHKIRWGRILTPDYTDEYSAGPSNAPFPPRARSLRVVVPTAVGTRQDVVPTETAIASDPAYRATRRTSLSRSNAIRSSRSSRFGFAAFFSRGTGVDDGDAPATPNTNPDPAHEVIREDNNTLPVAAWPGLLAQTSDDSDETALQPLCGDSAARSEGVATTPVPPPSSSAQPSGDVGTEDHLQNSGSLPERRNAGAPVPRAPGVQRRPVTKAVDAKQQHADIEAGPEARPPKSWQEEEQRLKMRIEELENALHDTQGILTPLMNEVGGDRGSDAGDWDGWTTDLRRLTTELRQSRAFVASVGEITPRAVLLLKLLQHQPKSTKRTQVAEPSYPSQSGLDVPINLDRATNFSRGLDAGAGALIQNTIVKACALCRVPKFINAPDPSATSPTALQEFHPRLGTTTCCGKAVCQTCLPAAILSSITRDWWQNLGLPHWLRCPIPSCPATLPIRYNVDLTNVLRSLGDPKALHHVMQFDRANLLRAALEGLATLPSAEALTKAAKLHAQLASHGRIRGFFELRQILALKIEMMSVDHGRDGTLEVPIFTGLFLRRKKSAKGRNKEAAPAPTTTYARECIVCAESVLDVVDGTPEDEARWAEATKGFPGEWQARMRLFPAPSLVPECGARHAAEICRQCIATHVATQLETQGRAGCERLSCPAPDCAHVYTDGELRLLATAETYARRDRFRLLNHLATLPNFRWCLRDGCEAGQIYDMPDAEEAAPGWDGVGGGGAVATQRVTCDECGFDMCFAHQSAWHAGLSCAGFDAQLKHGDPDVAATRAWIADNTKPCPGAGCGVPVEKKGGCFHMTCTTCAFEFCWECLADWRKISRGLVLGRRMYNRRGHNEGCYFRGSDAVEPTMLMGNRLEDALDGM